MDKLPDLNWSGHSLPQPYAPASSGMASYHLYPMDDLDDGGLNLHEIWRILVKYRRTILLFTAIVLVTAWAATLMMKPVYRATAVIEIAPERSNVVGLSEVGLIDANFWAYQQSQVRIIRSDSVAEAVIDRLNLGNNPLFTGQQEQRGLLSGLKQIADEWLKPLWVGVRSVFSSAELSSGVNASDNKSLDAAVRAGGQESSLAPQAGAWVGRVLGPLNVTQMRNSNLFEVSYESFDPVLAASIANAVVEEYMRLTGQRRFQSTLETKSYLDGEIKRIQGKLETSEKDLTAFARSNQVVDLEERNNIIEARLQDLNSSLTNVRSERIAAEALYKQAENADHQTLPMMFENELISELKASYMALLSEQARLSQIYKPKYPKLQQLNSQIANVQSSLNEEISDITSSLKVRYEQLMGKENLLAQAVEQQNTQLLDLKDRTIQYNILKREWETNKELYTGLLERMKEVDIVTNKELDNISLIDKAVIPGGPFKPSLQKNMMMALAFGLMGGIGLAFLLAFLDNTVRTPEEVERLLHLPSLGLMPKIAPKALPENVTLDLLAHQMREKDLVEALRSIRTSLMFSTVGGVPKTLLITSASPAEGKSMTAINLSIVLAQAGASVLLIDGDLRAPRLHKVFLVPRGPGLTDYLVQGDLKLLEETGIDNLSLLTSGTAPPNPAELLSSSAMDHLLEGLSEKYDYVLIDSAPIMGLADPIVLGTKVKGVLLVAAAGKISKGALREAVKRLRAVRAPLTGVVLNQVEPDSSEYGYYSRYYYNYGGEQHKLARRPAA